MSISITPPKPPVAKKLGRIALTGAAYGGFFVVCFTIFAYWFFPYDRLRQYLLEKVNQPSPSANGSPAVQLKIADLGPWRLTGAHLKGVELTKPAPLAGKEPIKVSIDELWARISLLSLLSKGQRVAFEADIGSGEISGTYAQNSERMELDETFERVDISKIGFGGIVGLPVKGTLNGTIELLVPADASKSQGKIQLAITRLKIGDGKAKFVTEALRDGFTIEAIDAGDVQLELEVKNGVAQVTKLTSKGKDLELEGNGSVRLAKEIANTTLNLSIDFKFSDAYKQRNDRTRALFDLMNMQPTFKRAQTPTGSLRYQITGKVTNLRAVPGRTATKAAKTTEKKSRKKK
jgi:type II secretion system protein N